MREQDAERDIDFIVIGAQKSGTTSLWQYLRKHPRIHLPESKEAPLFSSKDPPPDDLPVLLSKLFADAPADALLGKVTPDYMVGENATPVEIVAGRIAAAMPGVKLIALLRDPIDRAVSSYVMAVRREQEERSLDEALSDLLDPRELANARAAPSPTNSYVVAGEYGRLLGVYRALFPAVRLFTAFSEDLGRDPGAVLDAVLGFLGLPGGFRPRDLGVLYFRGGTRKLLDAESEKLLFQFHEEEILPRMKGCPAEHRRAFRFFYETWNVAPEDKSPRISPEIRRRLEEHFRRDAEKLTELDVSAPWIARWDQGL